MKTKVINLYGGPCTGKSTTAAALFAEMKFRGVNCEYIQEFAKDKAWEFGNMEGSPKILDAQEFIFAEQHFRIRRCAAEVDLVITDSPLLLGLVYTGEDFPLPSLPKVIKEAHDLYDNLNIFLVRASPYNPKGRFQTEEEAIQKDIEIRSMLDRQFQLHYVVPATRDAIGTIADLACKHWDVQW